MLPSLQILVIDDDADICANVRDILEMDGHQVDIAFSASEAFKRDDWQSLDAILLDRRLPEGLAETLMPRLKAQAPQADIMVVTGSADLAGAIAAMRQGAIDYIIKPINPDALRASLIRLAQKKQLSQAKQRSEAALGTLLQASATMIVILRSDHTLLYFNQFAAEMTGYQAEEVVGRDYVSLFLPEEYREAFAEDLCKVLSGIPTRGFETRVRCRDGSERWLLWNAQKLDDYEEGPAVLAIGRDITSLKQAQDQALQSARLAAIGQMVTGLAHESGNALARTQACLELLAMEVEDRPHALDLIHRVQIAQEHLRQLYEEVRGYAAPLKLECDPWDLAGIWRQAWHNLSLIRQGKNTHLVEHTDSTDLTCVVDPFRLEQVFRNILENSLAACGNHVRIDITCTDAPLGWKPALRIVIKDNGPGLNAEQQQRIFEPFFTTKTKGTGLGMAICQRIVQAHGGQIAVGPSSSQGAEIIITLLREMG